MPRKRLHPISGVDITLSDGRRIRWLHDYVHERLERLEKIKKSKDNGK